VHARHGLRWWLLSIVLFPIAVPAQDTIRFTPTVGSQAFKVREPVLRLKPGQVLVSETLMGGYYTEAGGAWPGEVGPIYIEGATPKDQLVIKLLKVRPNRDLAPARVNPNFGGLSSDVRVRMLNPPIPDIRFLWRLDRKRNLGVLELPKMGSVSSALASRHEHRGEYCRSAIHGGGEISEEVFAVTQTARLG
jgi:hypothetical protein